MPSTDYPVKLTGPETHRVADMAGVLMDLRLAAATVKQLERHRDTEKWDNLLMECMQDSALIHYGRCYSGGIRTAFLIPREWIDVLPAELRLAHQDFLDLRDKHIAHSVNDWEINTPVARVRIDQETGEVKVHQVTVNKSRVVMLASDSLEKLWQLAKTLGDRVEEEMKLEQAKLLEIAKQIPVEELKRRIKEDPPDFPGQRKVGNARARP